MGIFQNLVVDALARYFPRLRESLRLNLLRGKFHLEDVEIAPSVLIFGGLPLQIIDGRIGSLSIQVPWTKLFSSSIQAQADEFCMSFLEIPFPSSQQSVFDAFATDADNEKKRKLAEGERGKSPLTRILRRILPMLLDRFELNVKNVTIEIKFVSGHVGIIRLKELSTRPAPHDVNRGDFEKLITASDISFTVSPETGHPLLFLSETSIFFDATFRGGAWHIDIQVPNFDLEVDCSFSSFFGALSSRSIHWNIAYLNQRPNETVEKNPRIWFQYITRRVTSAFCKRRIHFSVNEARRKARSFVEYKTLHVRRLRSIASNEEYIRISELERSLGTDAILVLRDQARKHALANEVSSFATRDWLRWAFLGTDVSQEQEQVAEELKYSLTVAKYGQTNSSQEVSEISSTWSKIRFGINVSFFRVVIADEVSKLALNVKAILMQAELDSTLEAYNVSLYLGGANVVDGEKLIWIGFVGNAGLRNLAEEEQDLHFLEFKLHKLGFENEVSSSIVIQSSIAEFDLMTNGGFERMKRVVVFAKSVQCISSSGLNARSNSPMARRSLKTMEVSKIQGRMSVNVARFTLLVKTAVQRPRSSSLKICYTLSDILANIERRRNTKIVQRGVLEIAGYQPFLSNSVPEGLTSIPNLDWSEESKFLELNAIVNTCASENRVEVDIADGTGFLKLFSISSVINSIFSTHHRFISQIVPQINGGSGSMVETGRDASAIQSVAWALRIPSMDFKLRDIDEQSSITDVVSLKIGEFGYEAEGRGYHVIRAEFLEVCEPLFRGSVILAKSELAVNVNDKDVLGAVQMETDVEKLSITMSEQGLSRISSIVNRALESFRNPVYGETTCYGERISDQIRFESDTPTTTASFSIRLRRTVVKCVAHDIRIRTSLENVLLIRQDGIVSGFLDNVEVINTSDVPSPYKALLTCVDPVIVRSPRRRALSFIIASGATNIQVSTLQVMWLKYMNCGIARMLQSFQRIMDDVRSKVGDGLHNLGSRAVAGEPDRSQGYGPLTIQGWDLAVIFPFSGTNHEAVCASASQVTATFSPKGQVISLRGGQVLTRSDLSQENPLPDEAQATRESQWVVLVREIDVDLSHHRDDKGFPSQPKRKVRDKWSIDILRRASFLTTPSQIQILQRCISNLFRTEKKSPPSDGVVENQAILKSSRELESQNEGEESQHEHSFSFEEFSLEFQSHYISAELLRETATSNTTPASIANLNLDPTRLSWKRSSRYIGVFCDTDVITWRLTSAAVGLEDRTAENPSVRRIILHTRHEIDSSRSFHELRSGVQTPKTTLCIEAIERTDSETKTTGSYHISLHRAQVVVCPPLFQALKNFWDQCFDKSSAMTHERGEENKERDQGNLEHFSSSDRKESTSTFFGIHPTACRLEGELLRVPESKVTLSLRNTTVLLFNEIESGRTPFLSISLEYTRAILLRNQNGCLLEGCHLKFKNVNMTILRYRKGPQTFVSQQMASFTSNLKKHPPGMDHHEYGNILPGEYSLFRDAGRPSRSSFSRRREPGQGPVRSGRASLESGETVFYLRIVDIKLPSFEQNLAVISVPNVCIDCHLESLLYFTLLCPDLELTSLTGTPTIDTGQNRKTLILPDTKFIIGSVSLRTRIETTAALLTQHESVRNHATIRLTGHVDLLIKDNFSSWKANIQAAGDVVDEERGICDPILSPTSLSIEAWIEEKCVKIWTEHFLRIALSPLTVRTVTGAGFTTLDVLKKYRTRFIENQNTGDENKPLSGMEVQFSIPGFVVRCFAEQPRAQLLRLVLRDITCLMSFPKTKNEEGKAEVLVHDVILEDTISSYLRESGVRESRTKPCYTIVTSAREGSHVDQRRRLVLETESAPCSSTLWHQNNEGEDPVKRKMKPVFFCLISWYPPFEQVTAQVGGSGLDIRINLGILPTFVEWFETLAHEYAAVQRAQHHRYRTNLRSSRARATESFLLGIDHIVVEPMSIIISVSAPPRDLQLSWAQRAISWMVSAESTDRMAILLPKVVFTGDFSSTEQFLLTFRASYLRALLSRQILKQIVLQTHRIARFGRVMATSWARRRSHLPLISGHESYVERKGSAPNAVGGIGLVGALKKVQFGLATHIREVHDVDTAEDEGRNPAPPTPKLDVENRSIQTIDITGRRLPAHDDDESQNGKSLFLWLRAHDHRIPRNERFENNFSFSPAVSMLITSRFLLFVNRSTRAIQEPIITRANIAEYHTTGPRITIVTVSSDSISLARFAALQRERDSPSLARYLRASPRISQIQMHEIECISPQYASWLQQQLPPQSDALRSRLYNSR
ncbi:unnamed protein product [Agarophyton chilense]|eukprot:gb/GEZJ01001669.1/.p1 GENE.gb/GEZJ01001669.1/~~gb/GEZJ01001669.1/.p1  ORF type:complete len:2292 (+),score=214.98 gb/GEZJ01001669.1/:386-7261(+)